MAATPEMRPRPGPTKVPVVVALAALIASLAGPVLAPAPAGAVSVPASWSIALAASASAQVDSGGPPSAPAGATATCVSALSNQVTITWNAVAGASTYSLYYSTVSAGGPYSLLTSGIATTIYTTGGLAVATFWFEVAAVRGTYWQGPNSAATAGRTIVAITCV